MRKIISFVLALILMIWMKSIKTFFPNSIGAARNGAKRRRNNMKKQLHFLVVFLLVLSLSLVACGGTDTIPESIENLVIDDSVEYDYSNFWGTWLGEDGSVLIMEHIEDITNSERFMLSDTNNELLASGDIQYVEEYDHVYAHNEHDGIAHRCWFDEDNALHIDSVGIFSKVSGDTPGETVGDNSDEFSSVDSGYADDGRGDLLRDDGDVVPVMMGGALPFINMQTLQSENNEDGTYYYADATEDGQIIVVNTVFQSYRGNFDQTFEDYMTDCALTLADTNIFAVQNVEQNETYSENMSYPVYIVTYTSGENEDMREWTVFVMNTDSYTYLYGFCATLDAEDDMDSVHRNIFAGLYLSDGE